MNFTEKDLRDIVNALHVAAVEYGKDAACIRHDLPKADKVAGAVSLMNQFTAQAATAKALAERITAEIG